MEDSIVLRKETRHFQTSPWTPEKVERMKELTALKYSARRIAEDLGPPFTRCSIIGKWHREGVDVPRKQGGQKGAKHKSRPRPQRTLGTYVAGKYKRRNLPLGIMEQAEISDLPPDTSEYPVRLFDLQPHHCRYPLGDPATADFRFCGDLQSKGCSYCPRHFQFVYRVKPCLSA